MTALDTGTTRRATNSRSRQRPAAAETKPPYINRELSWLDWNARVLHEARDERNPLLERAKFLAIFATNLDEFFQVRVAGLRQQVAAGSSTTSPEGRTAAEQLAEIRRRAQALVTEQAEIFAGLRQ